ncbi:MAG TPA: putative Ig domain-containing protein, partial [Nitrospiraceae bacterium]|nr:putative Ig domain-containing protein [Nitrospiraceae bacterium]
MLLAADLTGLVQATTFLDPAVPNSPATATVQVLNRGDAAATRASQVAIYASQDAAFGPSDVLLGNANTGNRINAGKSDNVTVALTIPESVLPGTYSLMARVDATNVIAEGAAGEANNISVGRSFDVAWQFGNVPNKAGRTDLVLHDADGTAVTFRLDGAGRGTVIPDGTQWDISLSGTDTRSVFSLMSNGGDGRATVDDVHVQGPLGAINTPTTDVVGTLALDGPLTAGMLVGNLTGALASAPTIQGTTIQGVTIQGIAVLGNVTRSTILMGAQLGQDGQLGGTGPDADTYGAATVGTLYVRGSMSDSSVRVGQNPVDGIFDNGNDVLDQNSGVTRVQIDGDMSQTSQMLMARLPSTLLINGQQILAASDARFQFRVLAPTNSFQGLGDLPGGAIASRAYAVSADGSTVVGESASTSGSKAFRWTSVGVLEDLNIIGLSRPYDVSDDGRVIVGRQVREVVGQVDLVPDWDVLSTNAFLWSTDRGSGWTGPDESAATAVSGDGRMVAGGTTIFTPVGAFDEAFRWTAMQGYVPLPAAIEHVASMSRDGALIGGYTLSNGETVYWTTAGVTRLGNQFDRPIVSPDGSVIAALGKLWDPSTNSAIRAIPNGVVAASNGGRYLLGPNFVWDAVLGKRDLRSILVNEFGLASQLQGWTSLTGTDITPDGGTIVGWGNNPNGQIEAWRARLVRENDAPNIQAALEHDTGSTNMDAITRDPTIVGKVTDASRIASAGGSQAGEFSRGFQARLLGSQSGTTNSFVDITSILQSDGSFRLDRAGLSTIFGQSLPDDTYTLTLKAIDAHGNTTEFRSSFTLDTTPPPLSMDLSQVSDSGIRGDRQTALTDVGIEGFTENNATVNLFERGLHTTAIGGRYIFPSVQLALGPNVFHFGVVDSAGNSSTFTETFTRVAPQAPVLSFIGAKQVDEGELLQFSATAADPDSDPSRLQYRLELPGTDPFPAGAVIDPATGAFTWTPTTDQGPGTYSVFVVVTDEAGLTDGELVPITVNEPTPVAGASFQGLGDLVGGPVFSKAYAVSRDGSLVVGESETTFGHPEAFRWSPTGGITGLGELSTDPFSPVFSTWAFDVSGDGGVIVGAGSTLQGQRGFYSLSNSGLTELPQPDGGGATTVRGVSDNGAIMVGLSGNSAIVWRSALGQVQVLEGNGLLGSTAAAASGDGAIVVGRSGGEATLWRSVEEGPVGLGRSLNQESFSDALDISTDGNFIVGYAVYRLDSRDAREAWIWRTGSGRDFIGDLTGGEVFSEARAVSDSGDVVVGRSTSTSLTEAFVWDSRYEQQTPGFGMRSLKDVLIRE